MTRWPLPLFTTNAARVPSGLTTIDPCTNPLGTRPSAVSLTVKRETGFGGSATARPVARPSANRLRRNAFIGGTPVQELLRAATLNSLAARPAVSDRHLRFAKR